MKTEEAIRTIVTIAMYLFVPLVFALQYFRTKRCREEIRQGVGFDKIAAALGGEVATDPSFEGPFVRFLEQGQRAYFYQTMLSNANPKVLTSLECRIGFPGFLEATSTASMRYPSKSPRFRRLADLAGFQIVTTDPQWAAEVLGAGLGQILREINSWRRRPARIQLAGDRFLVEMETRLDAERTLALAGFMSRVAALGGRRAPDSAGIKFLGEVALTQQGRCPVCCQPYEPPGIQCPQCRTPHHSDCWAYWGRCAIFGCRPRRAA